MNVYIDSCLKASVWPHWSASLIQDGLDGFVPSAGNQLGILYMELSSFLFCKIMEYVNLCVCKSLFLSLGLCVFF